MYIEALCVKLMIFVMYYEGFNWVRYVDSSGVRYVDSSGGGVYGRKCGVR